MAYPVIQYDASAGSDTQASGAGLVTAIYGANADLTDASDFVDLSTDSPDLSSVPTDGSAVIWLDRGSDIRHLHRILAVDTGTPGVTIEDTIAGTSVVAWAIGGKRQSMQYRSSWEDWKDIRGGWTFEFDSGTYDVSVNVQIPWNADTYYPASIFRAADGTTLGDVIWNQTADGFMFGTDTNYAQIWVEGIKFTTTASTKTYTYINAVATNLGLSFKNCWIKTQSTYGIYYSGAGSLELIRCYIESASSRGVYCSASPGGLKMIGCTVRGSGSDMSTAAIQAVGGDRMATTIAECLIDNATGDGILVGGSYNQALVIRNNTIVNNDSDGVEISAGSTFYGTTMAIYNNIFAFNGAYGLRSNSSTYMLGMSSFFDYNAFYSNTSGARLNVPTGDNDVTLSGDPFINKASNDYRLDATSGEGAACQGVGFPLTLLDGT